MVGVMLDTKGPEILTGEMSSSKVSLCKDNIIELTTNMEHVGDDKKIAVDFEGLPDAVSPG